MAIEIEKLTESSAMMRQLITELDTKVTALEAQDKQDTDMEKEYIIHDYDAGTEDDANKTDKEKKDMEFRLHHQTDVAKKYGKSDTLQKWIDERYSSDKDRPITHAILQQFRRHCLLLSTFLGPTLGWLDSMGMAGIL